MDDFLEGLIGGVAADRVEQRARGRIRTLIRWWNGLVMVVGGSLLLFMLVLFVRDCLR